MIKKLKRKLKRKIKRIRFNIILNARVILCRNADGKNYPTCGNCKHTQKCYWKYLKRVKWLI